jgi:hypothetical protein
MPVHSSPLTEHFTEVPMKPLFSASPYTAKVSGSRRERLISQNIIQAEWPLSASRLVQRC